MIPKTGKLSIGEKLARIRELLGFKQAQFAKILGISQQAISKMERSKKIDPATLDRAVKGLGITVDIVKNFNENLFIARLNKLQKPADSQTTDHQTDDIPSDLGLMDKVIELYERVLMLEWECTELRKRNKSLLKRLRAEKKAIDADADESSNSSSLVHDTGTNEQDS